MIKVYKNYLHYNLLWTYIRHLDILIKNENNFCGKIPKLLFLLGVIFHDTLIYSNMRFECTYLS